VQEAGQRGAEAGTFSRRARRAGVCRCSVCSARSPA
jgi:hypothetical protein